MEDQDKLFDKIKSAAENAENKDFSGMEKVWSRVDAKLDTYVEKKNNKNWQKLMIAASILIVSYIGFQFFNSKNITNNTNEILVNKDTIVNPKIIENNQKAIVNTDTTNPNIRKNVDKILEKQLSTTNSVAIEESKSIQDDAISIQDEKKSKIEMSESPNIYNSASSNAPGNWYGNRKFDARGVAHQDVEIQKDSIIKSKEVVAAKKLEPLILVNDKITKRTLDNLSEEEIENMIVLKDPIYYINKVLYTEQEVFGPNPTCPYSPLSKQDIETIYILLPEKAIPIYGKRGEKGVVLITTKDGKPKPKKE
jgi:hypothetical protein